MKLVFKYLKHNVRRCLEFYLVWVFVHFKLYDSKQRDPCEIAQTHMLSWAFSDHICRKYQQAIYEIPWYQFIGGTAQVDFMFGCDCKQSIFQACTAVYLNFVMTVQNISDASAT